MNNEMRREALLLPRKRTILSRHRVQNLIGRVVRNNPAQKLFLPDYEYINLGSGMNLLRNFINIDWAWFPGINLCWDIRKGLPLKSSTYTGVYSEHMLEHMEWNDALDKVLPEVYRILKPGGRVRIAVPDAEQVVMAYAQAREEGLTEKVWNAERPDLNRIPLTPMGLVNNAFRRIYEPYVQGHKFMYDFQTLEYFLRSVGFRDIVKVDYMQGADENMLVDYAKRRNESIYVEAVKPSDADQAAEG